MWICLQLKATCPCCNFFTSTGTPRRCQHCGAYTRTWRAPKAVQWIRETFPGKYTFTELVLGAVEGRHLELVRELLPFAEVQSNMLAFCVLRCGDVLIFKLIMGECATVRAFFAAPRMEYSACFETIVHVELFMYILRERILALYCDRQLMPTAMRMCIRSERYPFEIEILNAMPWKSRQTTALSPPPPPPPPPPPISHAMQILRHLYEHADRKHDFYGVTEVSRKGCVNVLSYLVLECGYEMKVSMLRAAAQGAQLSTLDWLLSHGCPFDTTVCDAACVTGNLRFLTLIRERYKLPWDITTICRLCTSNLKAYVHRTKLPTEQCACDRVQYNDCLIA